MSYQFHPKAQALRDKAALLAQERLSIPLPTHKYTEKLAKLCDEAVNTVELLEHSIALAELLKAGK